MSRNNDPTPVTCLDCMWSGPLADCIHGYVAIGDEAEPEDYCPNCRSYNLIVEEDLPQMMAEQAMRGY